MTDPWLIKNTEKEIEKESTDIEPKTDTLEIGLQEQQKKVSGTSSTETASRLEFEDNFAPSSVASPQLDNQVLVSSQKESNSNVLQPLPDSATYLQGLERKLQKIKKGSKLVDALSEKRQDCLRTLLQEDGIVCNSLSDAQLNNDHLELDKPISNGESTVQEIYRHLQPMQPVTVGETVHIVEHDQLDQQRQEAEEANEDLETPESR